MGFSVLKPSCRRHARRSWPSKLTALGRTVVWGFYKLLRVYTGYWGGCLMAQMESYHLGAQAPWPLGLQHGPWALLLNDRTGRESGIPLSHFDMKPWKFLCADHPEACPPNPPCLPTNDPSPCMENNSGTEMHSLEETGSSLLRGRRSPPWLWETGPSPFSEPHLLIQWNVGAGGE